MLFPHTRTISELPYLNIRFRESDTKCITYLKILRPPLQNLVLLLHQIL